MYKLSAKQLHQAFLDKKYSAVEIITYFLKRIEKLNEKTNSFINVFEERALERAKKLDAKLAAGQPVGKLAAVPIGLKDNMCVEGELTTCCSNFLQNYRSPYDATVVRLLEEADAIILGKTNLDEFAMGSSTEYSFNGTSKNPWDLERSPGGSSGGSAAAVASRLCPITLGSDTGGSIRQPASFTSTVGFKPTYGRVSRYGLVAFASSLDQIGPITYNVEDSALVMEVLGNHCEKDSTSIPKEQEEYLKKMQDSIKGKKIGIPRSFLGDLKGEAKDLFEESINTFIKLGATIVDVNLEKNKYSVPIYYILAPAEASTNLARYDGVRYGKRSEKATSLDAIYDLSKQEGFGKEVKRRIMLGTFVLSSGYQDAFYKKAQKVRRLIIEDYKKAFEECDVVVMPVTPVTPFKSHSISDPVEMYLQDLYTISANMAGLPAISVPCGFVKDLPFGLHIVGPQLGESAVFNFAHNFEKATTLSKTIPQEFDMEVSS